VRRFTPLLIDAARPCRHATGGHWFVDETYVKVAGVLKRDHTAGVVIRCHYIRAESRPGPLPNSSVTSSRSLESKRAFDELLPTL